jgi:hypothetical protein
MRKLWLAVAAGALATAPLRAAQPAPVTPRPVVLELFTSEGCSSCPPADALLGELARSRTDVLALAFHVTYWDRLGWPDPFALEAATARQRAYSATMGLDGIYTPQMVVDGVHDVVGSDRQGVLAAVRRSQSAAAAGVPLRLSRAGDGITVEVGAGNSAGTVLLAGYDPNHTTSVKHGENAGRTLAEANIVRGLLRVGEWTGSAVALHAKAPAGERVAALLQAADGKILGAALLE